MRLSFATMADLFKPESAVPKGLLKSDVLEHFKRTNLIGVPETQVHANLEGDDSCDILVTVVSPEEALGTPVYRGEKAYFDDLDRQLYEPGEEELE